MASLKPIGIPIAFILIIISILKIKKLRKSCLIIIIFLIPQIFENTFFYNNFNERETVFKQSVVGKLLFLSGKDSFDIKKYPKELHVLLKQSKEEFRPIHQYLNNIDNILLKSELLADYEVVAQYQSFNFESIRKLKFNTNILYNNSINIFIKIIKNNFLDYLALSLHHYLGNWSIGSKVRSTDFNKKLMPKYEELKKSSGPMNLPNMKLLELTQIFFLFLFFILLIYSILILLSLIRVIKYKVPFLDLSLIVFIQIYLLLISFTNVSTPRYLMVVYPLIILLGARFLNLIQTKIMELNKK